jgi:hypothetical protein
MKHCIQCDQEYPDTDNFCEMDGAYLLPVEDIDELPAGLCKSCDGVGRMVNVTGDTIITCGACGGTGKVKE